MRKLEEMILRKFTYSEIALMLDVSISTVSDVMSKSMQPTVISEVSSYHDLIQSTDNNVVQSIYGNYTISDLDWIKENDSEYFRELLKNDYLKDDRIPMNKNIIS